MKTTIKTEREAELARALYEAHDAFARLTPDQQVHHRHQQRTSFAYGNLAISRVRPTGREYAVDPAIHRLDEDRLMTLVKEAAGPCPCGTCAAAAAVPIGVTRNRSNHDGDGPCSACAPASDLTSTLTSTTCQVGCVLRCCHPDNLGFLRQAIGMTEERVETALREGSVHAAQAFVAALLDEMSSPISARRPTFSQVKCVLEHVSKMLSRSDRNRSGR